MKMTTKSEYSLLALIYIARQQNATHFVRIEEICNYYALPKKYLEQLLNILKQNRYVKAKRGPSGGFRLAKPASEISIADIIRLMDGALAPTESVSTYFYSETPISKEQKMLKILKTVRDFISDLMEKTTLQDLI